MFSPSSYLLRKFKEGFGEALKMIHPRAECSLIFNEIFGTANHRSLIFKETFGTAKGKVTGKITHPRAESSLRII